MKVVSEGTETVVARACLGMMGALRPACSLVELPPPNCADLLQRCLADTNCRDRLEDYESSCGYDRRLGGCPSNERCRQAVFRSLGTVMTTNCTCPSEELSNIERLRCTSALQRLQQQNICKDMAINDYRSHFVQATNIYFASTSATPTVTMTTTSGALSSWSNVSHPSYYSACQHMARMRLQRQQLANSPQHSFDIIRVYNGTSSDDCSELCRCPADLNSTLSSSLSLSSFSFSTSVVVCTSLPCNAPSPCRYRHLTHDSGSLFYVAERGSCRCVRGEVVCAKSPFKMIPKEGLFLHVGYSVVERHVIEKNSNLRLDSQIMLHKLTALLRDPTTSHTDQTCELVLYSAHAGNNIYEIRQHSMTAAAVLSLRTTQLLVHAGTKMADDSFVEMPARSSMWPVLRRLSCGHCNGLSVSPERQDHHEMIIQVCVEPAKSLLYRINSRQADIMSDPVISVIKMVQLERIHFHDSRKYTPPHRSPTSDERKSNDWSVDDSRDSATAVPSLAFLATTAAFILSFI